MEDSDKYFIVKLLEKQQHAGSPLYCVNKGSKVPTYVIPGNLLICFNNQMSLYMISVYICKGSTNTAYCYNINKTYSILSLMSEDIINPLV